MHKFSLILLTLFLTVYCQQYWVYTGAGGCDTDDPTCKQPPPIDLSTIYILLLDTNTGSITLVSKQTGFAPGWIVVHPTGKYLYSISQIGGVVSFAVDSNTGSLTVINSVSTPGPTVHMSVDPEGTRLFVASYGAGTISTFPIDRNTGQIGSMTSSMKFYGHGTNPVRQEAPHPHSINIDPKSTGRFVFVPDLGLDIVFSFDVTSGVFTNTSFTNTTRLPPGSGPRHMAFHPSKPVAYVLSEMGGTVTVFTYYSTTGQLAMPSLQTVHTIPVDFNGFNKAAEVLIDSTGRWLLASNRGFASPPSNSIVVYEIGMSGLLTQRGSYSSGGKFPRGVELSPEGGILVVGGQDSNNVATFRLDGTTGVLMPTGYNLTNIATPITFAFIKRS
jgi:6-phosphogluconolactonase